mgnify:CR=1 FL=1
MPAEFSALRLQGCPMELSAAYRQNDALFLRLYETSGEGGWASLSFPAEWREIQAVDFLGRAMERAIERSEGTARLLVRPWEIITLRLKSGS